MGQRIYRVNPPDVEGEVFDADDAARLVGAGIYTRRPPGAEPSRRGGSAKRKPAVKPSTSSTTEG